jgi:hypothetical protein
VTGEMIPFATGRTTTLIPVSRLKELVIRMGALESAAPIRAKISEAIESGGTVKLAGDDEKRTVDAALDHWLSDEGIQDLGDELIQLRDEVKVDLGYI